MAQPIRQFINNLFSSKPQENRNKWTQCLIDQEYEMPEQLASISEEGWKELEKHIPLKIREIMKTEAQKLCNKAQPSTSELNNRQAPTQNTQTSQISQAGQERYLQYKLNPNEKENILSLLEKEFTPSQVLNIVGAKPLSSKQASILEYIRLIERKPLPQPANSLKIKPKQTKDPMLPLYHYVGHKDITRKYYTFIVIGETGSGKTTLLDAFVNYFTGIEYTDTWRWKLVDESHLNDVSGKYSQTSSITQYYINDIRNQFNIRLIDTPGYGDTKGLQTDDQTTKKFQELFKKTPEVDFILLTKNSNETRLNHRSKYIIHRISQLFGKDAEEHFILMCTFSDDKTPLCLPSIQQFIKYQRYFTFNNSALYTPSDKAQPTTKFYWRMAMDSIKNFFEYIIHSKKLPLSLQMSRNVLQNRRKIEQSIKKTQQLFNDTINKLSSAKQTFAQLQKNKKLIEQNGSYTKTTTKVIQIPDPNQTFYQYCRNCNQTCCQSCRWPYGYSESQCTYFNNGGRCPRCRGNCGKYDHRRTDPIIITKTIYQNYVCQVTKADYDKGMRGADLYKRQYQQQTKNIDQLVANVLRVSQQMKEQLKELQSTAMKPKLYTDKEFYTEMIRTEQNERQPGYAHRVQNLKAIVQRIDKLGKLTKSLTADELFPDLKTVKEQNQQVNSS